MKPLFKRPGLFYITKPHHTFFIQEKNPLTGNYFFVGFPSEKIMQVYCEIMSGLDVHIVATWRAILKVEKGGGKNE